MFKVCRRFISVFQQRVSPQAFVCGALIIAGLWFLGIYPFLNSFHQELLPKNITTDRTLVCDFAQYYAGAVAARDRHWQDLYPIVNEAFYKSPPPLEPMLRTPLFDPKVPVYPLLNTWLASDFPPYILQRVPELTQLRYAYRYFNPPPLALLLSPLAYWDFPTAAYHVWPVLCIASFFGVAWFSSRIFRELHGRVSYVEGLIVLAVVLFSFRGETQMGGGNVNPILSLLIALAAYGWIRGWQGAVGAAMIPLLLFKAIGLNWCPFLVLRRVRWRTILTLALLTVVLNGVMIWLAGWGIYQKYLFEVMPKSVAPSGDGLVGTVVFLLGIYPSRLYFVLTMVFSLLLYWGYFQRMKSADTTERKAVIAAALGGGMAVYCALNFSSWIAYLPVYLVLPFLGWMVWEVLQAQGKWRMVLGIGAFLCFFLLAGDWLVREFTYLLYARQNVDRMIVQVFQIFLIAPFFLFVALRRLLAAPLVMEAEGKPLEFK